MKFGAINLHFVINVTREIRDVIIKDECFEIAFLKEKGLLLTKKLASDQHTSKNCTYLGTNMTSK